MKVAFFGSRDRGSVCLEALAEKHEIWMALVPESNEDPTSKTALALSDMGRKFPVISTLAQLGLLPLDECDVAVLARYPKLLPKEIWDKPRLGTINLHAGPLPQYRGPHPMNWMLINGETWGGFSIVQVDEGVDTGNILAQQMFSIGVDDDYNDIVKKSLEIYPKLLLDTLSRIKNGFKGYPQDKNEGFWCSRRTPEESEIDFYSMTDIEIHNMVRALVPPMPSPELFWIGDPTECGYGRGTSIYVVETRIIKREYRGVSGKLVAKWPSGVVITCKNRGLLVTKVMINGEVKPAAEILSEVWE